MLYAIAHPRRLSSRHIDLVLINGSPRRLNPLSPYRSAGEPDGQTSRQPGQVTRPPRPQPSRCELGQTVLLLPQRSDVRWQRPHPRSRPFARARQRHVSTVWAPDAKFPSATVARYANSINAPSHATSLLTLVSWAVCGLRLHASVSRRIDVTSRSLPLTSRARDQFSANSHQ